MKTCKEGMGHMKIVSAERGSALVLVLFFCRINRFIVDALVV